MRDYPLTAANHAVSSNPDYDGDEWYTPTEYIEAARSVMGEITVDPASAEEAQRIVQADRYYIKQEDSLGDDICWYGCAWVNPPYSKPLINQFVGKVISEYDKGHLTQAIILTNNSSDTKWFHSLLARFPACFTQGRVSFWRAGGEVFGARQGQTLFYLGDNVEKFKSVFSDFGLVVSV